MYDHVQHVHTYTIAYIGYLVGICNIYSMVGRSIADIYDRGVIFTEARSAEVNMLAEVGYRGYGLTYRATYNILYGKCATGIANQASFSFSLTCFHLYLNTAVDKDSWLKTFYCSAC